ncbi:hypothetical protein HT031_001071 [Scenedesmus sp. PABB004]|nr:hypothetical protein HT031_001071 [Scenedesmus sp. PABB004]
MAPAASSRLRALAAALLLAALAAAPAVRAQSGYTTGQATWYDSISNGFCGYGSRIPSNGFVGAWPFIETSNTSSAGVWQPGVDGDACGKCFEVSCVPGFVESADGTQYFDRRDACEAEDLAVVIKIVDECRCSGAGLPLNQRGNYKCGAAPGPAQAQHALRGAARARSARAADLTPPRAVAAAACCGRLAHRSCVSGTPASTSPKPSSRPPASSISIPMAGQCGGRGGGCALYGAAACVDAQFDVADCAEGLECTRYNARVWRCWVPLVDAAGTGPLPLPGDPLPPGAQCGGGAWGCKQFVSAQRECGDAPFDGFSCGKGLRCSRADRSWWQCELDAAKAQPGGEEPSSAGPGGGEGWPSP